MTTGADSRAGHRRWRRVAVAAFQPLIRAAIVALDPSADRHSMSAAAAAMDPARASFADGTAQHARRP